jgi:hypothetical protein
VPPFVCTLKSLPPAQQVAAAQLAIRHNPVNAPPMAALMLAVTGSARERLAVVTSKYFRTNGVRLTVGFLDRPSSGVRRRILAHLNAWGTSAKVQFVPTGGTAQVRIARAEGGFWSYLGTDILLVPTAEPTMNLDGFTDRMPDRTPESEYRRIVRHEAGHTLGFPHEHARRAIVDLLDPAKVQAYFQATQGWTEAEINQQILTPLEESTLWGTVPDTESIMTYQFPGELTRSGLPILGGLDISAQDRIFAAAVYPKHRTKPPKPPKK